MQFEEAERRIHQAVEKRGIFGPLCLLPGLAVAGGDIGLKSAKQGLPLRFRQVGGDHGGQVHGGLIDTRGRRGRQVFQIEHQDGHLAITQRVARHHQPELPAGRIDAVAQHLGQSLVGVGRPPQTAVHELRHLAPSGLNFIGSLGERFVQFGGIGRQGNDLALVGSQAAAQMTALAAEHAPVHLDIALHQGLHRFPGREQAVPVHLLAETQRFRPRQAGQHLLRTRRPACRGGGGGRDEDQHQQHQTLLPFRHDLHRCLSF